MVVTSIPYVNKRRCRGVDPAGRFTIILAMRNPIDHLADLFAKKGPFPRLAREFCTYLRKSFPHYNWVGIYMIEGSDTLVLKAWEKI